MLVAGLSVWAFIVVLCATAWCLPDGRVYEMVTPTANQDANVYVPFVFRSELEEGVPTRLPFQAAGDGGAVVYAGDPTSSGSGSSGEGRGNEYLAVRSVAGGWQQQNIQPPGYKVPTYQAFSSDLSVGVLNSCEPGLPVLVPGAPGDGYNVLYVRDNSDARYRALFTTTPTDRSPEEFGAFDIESYNECGSRGLENAVEQVAYAGSSGDLGHLLFEANGALTAGAPDGGQRANNLYDSVVGQLHLVNVLPAAHPGEPGVPVANATFGAPPMVAPRIPDFSHVISSDGSRIFWTDIENNDLYMRENDATTRLVSEGGRFWTATTDGSKVFLTRAKDGNLDKEGDLEEYDTATATTTDLTPEGPAHEHVQGVVGTSENGEYVYYVASNELYLHHAGATTPIAPLAPRDPEVVPPYTTIAPTLGGDLEPGLGNRTAEVTPDGRGVVFMSTLSLTGYPSNGLSEVYVYEAEAGRVFCVSCDPNGEPPPITTGFERTAGFLPISHSNTYLPRWISADGDRVFFDSNEPLVPQDNNRRRDVYEWEREGTGSCPEGQGNCVYLLSGGTSTADSWLLDASETGDDVFIITRAQLVAKDQNDDDNVFDIRVHGETEPTPPTCSGTGCQGAPPAPPAFATPASTTFEGVGNFLTGTERSTEPAQKPKARESKLTRALRACAAKPRHKRAQCRALARKHYGPKPKH